MVDYVDEDVSDVDENNIGRAVLGVSQVSEEEGFIYSELPQQKGSCSIHLQDKIKHFLLKGDLIDKLRNTQQFRNPEICGKLVENLSLEQFGSNCHPSLCKTFDECGFYDNLALLQTKHSDLIKKGRTSIEFVKVAPSLPSENKDKKRKRSKWDVAEPSSSIPPVPSQASSFQALPLPLPALQAQLAATQAQLISQRFQNKSNMGGDLNRHLGTIQSFSGSGGTGAMSAVPNSISLKEDKGIAPQDDIAQKFSKEVP
eukprot:GCRY01001375.1.p1 GENE.GCRY01001375.1~~GCRY01001375.1.p1  ORF type:complete len:271 (-),score=21.16 GCRY01001375.1:849-1619(-)